MAIVRWILALVTIAYALFNAIAPVSTLLYKLQHEWPEGWAAAQNALSFPTFTLGGVGVGRFTHLIQETNWLQVAMWLVADLLYIVSALRLMGRRSRSAGPVFAVALILDFATWLTFKRMPVYDLTFSTGDQQQDLTLFAVLAGLGLLVFLAGALRKRRRQLRPVMLME